MALEGGYGKAKIKSVEEAMQPEQAGTWPGIWFQSNQKNLSVYRRYDYLYSLLFGRQMISGGTVAHMTRHLDTRWHEKEYHGLVVDWGGSVFTAQDILDMSYTVGSVYVVNFEGPQLEFTEWYFSHYDPNIYPFDEEKDLEHLGRMIKKHKGPVTWLFSEVLEHEPRPIQYFANLASEFHFDEAYIASSFCTPAYGHYIPIIIGGQEYRTTRTANKAWRNAMGAIGYKLEKIEGWNSRLWWAKDGR
jgi:hypothetical protein